MRKYLKYIVPGLLLTMVQTSCTKTKNQFFANGTTPTLSVSATTLAPPVADSQMNVLAVSWTNPHYATDSATELYTIQIDSTGRQFAKAVSIQVSGALSDSITAETINNIANGFGFIPNVAYGMDIRVISSYANNNEQLTSNTVTITYTPYKVPPKVTPPSANALFIIGPATGFGWIDPVPTATQQFTQIDSVAYQGNFYLTAGLGYEFLPVNGSTSAFYNVPDSTVSGLSSGGSFQYSTGTGNTIPAPSNSGIYQIYVNFQTGTFTVTPVTLFAELWVPGDYQGWSPSTAPTLSSDTSNGSYQGYVDIATTNGFKFTSVPNWNGTNYGDTAANGESGVLSTNGSASNLNIAATGWYYVQANTTSLTWQATPITSWSLIGDFNNWSADVPMTYSGGVWTGTISPSAAGGFKIRANDAWNISYGPGGPAGSLTSNGGGNIPITAGTHTITMNLSTPGYYTYSIQ
jgi:starch-binding outer membrane protein SusE/F